MIPDVYLHLRKGQALFEGRRNNEDIIARQSACVTKDGARAFAKEDVLELKELYERKNDFCDVKSLLGASGKAGE